MRKVIAVDVDQVIADFVSGWMQCASEVLGYPVTSMNRRFSLNARACLPHRDANRVWEVFHGEGDAPGYWGRLPLFPDSVEALNTLFQAGFEVHAITSVPIKALEARRAAFAEVFPKIQVHGAESLDKGKKNGAPTKETWLREIGPCFFADDRFPHCQEALNAGVPAVYRIDGGHDGDGDEIPGVRTVPTLREALSQARLI